MTTTGLNESDRRKVQHAINVTRAQYSERQPRRARWGGVPAGGRVRVGLLDEALAAPSSITTPTTAEVSRYTYDSGTEQFSDSGQTDTVTNPIPGLSGASGAVVVYQPMAGIWIPIHVDCSTQNEVQTITITGTPTGGTFPLTFQGQTATIDFDYTAAEVQTDLEALSSIGSGNVSCSGGPLPGTAVSVEFQGDLANTNVDKLLTSSASLTGGTSPEVNVEVDAEGCCS